MTDRKNSRKSQPIDLSTMVYGKVPPQAKDLEEAVLGAIMLDKGAYSVASELLRPECFYVDAHQKVFRAMASLILKSQPIDCLTVVEELRSMGALEALGGPFFVTKLTNVVVSATHVRAHSRIIYQRWRKREVIRIAGEAMNAGFDDSTDDEDVVSALEVQVRALNNQGQSAQIRHIADVTVDVIQEIQDLRNKPGELVGVTTGYQSLNKITYGWQGPDLIILAARPAVGKTAFALNLARNAAAGLLPDIGQVGVGFFSLEMKDTQLVQRVLAAEARMYLGDIRRGRLDEGQMKHLYTNGVQRAAKWPIWIVKQPKLHILRMKDLARKMYDMGARLFIVDYLQLMNGSNPARSNQNRDQEIGFITGELKALALELNVPIIALSQMSREFEKDGGKSGANGSKRAPRLSDLRESGSIEQDADVVMFLYRPDERTILAIEKHRSGDAGVSIDFRFIGAEQRFVEWDEMGTPFQATAAAAGSSWKSLGTRMSIGGQQSEDMEDAF